MARRISRSQLRSKLNQLKSKQRQAINDYNRAVRKVNSAINQYNSKARAHNARVRASRQRLKSELNRLASRSTSARTVTYRVSVRSVYDAYTRYESQVGSDPADPRHAEWLDFAERESANSAAVANILLDETTIGEPAVDPRQTEIEDQLRSISPELDQRWRGAVFSLSPENPDAARHFCTSTREVFTQILEVTAPDDDVTSSDPACERTQTGKPTRRSKIRYVLRRKGVEVESLEEFVQTDIDNIIELFNELNSGTHGVAGRFDMRQLSAIKTRAEHGILFLASIVS